MDAIGLLLCSAFLPNPKHPDSVSQKSLASSLDQTPARPRAHRQQAASEGLNNRRGRACLASFRPAERLAQDSGNAVTEEFEGALVDRFDGRYPDGFTVEPPEDENFSELSGGFGLSRKPLHGDFERLPDIASAHGLGA